MIKSVIEKVEGYSHKRRNQPCQDAIGKYYDERTNSVIVAVADGHGNQMHRYSADGSAIAVQCLIDILKRTFQEDNPKEYIRANMGSFPKTVELEWKKRVKEFHEAAVQIEERQNPYRNAYLSENYEGGDYLVNILYGTTAIACLYNEEYSFAMQIGDGDITLVDEKGNCTFYIPSEPQVGSATNSLCMNNCHQYFRYRFIDHHAEYKPILVFLSTDGYSNSYISSEEFLQLVGDYVAIMHNYSEEEVSKVLVDWLDETSKLGSGDDISVGVIYNSVNAFCGDVDFVEIVSRNILYDNQDQDLEDDIF